VDRRLGRALSASLIAHGVGLAVLLFVGLRPALNPPVPQPNPTKLVFLQEPGHGGGGGGSPAPAPPKPMEIPKPAPAPAPAPVPDSVVVPPPVPTLTAPVETNAAAVLQASGISSVSIATRGGGGLGPGIGPGSGAGLGPGRDGGFGDDAFAPGSGITNPSIILQPPPSYTGEAMRAKIQGDVELDVVVLPNGTVGEIRIAKSLDALYGLDQEAVQAARQWLFHPGMRQGTPVPVRVRLVLTFRVY
jgi:protein TonB